jgi:FkbM family methyltransferase
MKTLIEVGAFDGEDSLKFHKDGYRVFTFEPEVGLFNALKQKTNNLENYTIIQKAVCLTNGKTKFNVCKSGGASSILEFKPDEELVKNWGPRWDIHYSGHSYDVDTTRLDTFIEEYNLHDTTIDYIHIDAQGVDLDALKSLGKYIANVKAGVVETVINKDKSIYKGQEDNTFQNVNNFLLENGFIVSNIQSNDGTNCEYNIYFMKNEESKI